MTEWTKFTPHAKPHVSETFVKTQLLRYVNCILFYDKVFAEACTLYFMRK